MKKQKLLLLAPCFPVFPQINNILEASSIGLILIITLASIIFFHRINKKVLLFLPIYTLLLFIIFIPGNSRYDIPTFLLLSFLNCFISLFFILKKKNLDNALRISRRIFYIGLALIFVCLTILYYMPSRCDI